MPDHAQVVALFSGQDVQVAVSIQVQQFHQVVLLAARTGDVVSRSSGFLRCPSRFATRRVPLVVRVPGMPANGKVCRQFVEFVDLVPTLGELVNLDLPKNLEGTSFVPLLTDPDQPSGRR